MERIGPLGPPHGDINPAYAATVTALLGKAQFGMKLGLDEMRRLRDALGQPDRRFATVHVAGTNGKGSVSAMMAAGLRAAGFRTGLYTSPHLVSPTERIRIDGQPLDEDTFARLFMRVEETARQTGLEPTFFETLTAMALLGFAEANVEFAVVEVGLGGRLDATNVVEKPVLSIITSIGLDHTEHLGPTLADIAREKAGIARPGVPLLIGRLPAEAEREVRRRAADVGAPLASATDDDHAAHWLQDFAGAPATGYQRDNLQVAGTALLHLNRKGLLSRNTAPPHLATLADAVAHAHWAGRQQWVNGVLPDHPQAQTDEAPSKRSPSPSANHVPVLLDGAHNDDGIAALAAWLADPHPPPPWDTRWRLRPRILIFGRMADKALSPSTLATLLHLFDGVVAVAPDMARALPAEALARELDNLANGNVPVRVGSSVHAGLDLALSWASVPRASNDRSTSSISDIVGAIAPPPLPPPTLHPLSADASPPLTGMVVIAGSLYLIGEAIVSLRARGRTVLL